MEENELEGLFGVMTSLLEDPGWVLDHPLPCTDTPWPGIECEVSQEDTLTFHITKIHIAPDVISPPCKHNATLSESLLKLPYLKTLSIFNCFVTKPINLSPTLFGSLSSLEHLSLESNPSLSGEIPASLGQIHSLRVLSLSQNNLLGKVPSELSGLVNLEQLDLSYNNISGEIPKEIGLLRNLAILDLSWNSLQGVIPSSFGELKSLEKIDLSSNKLSGKIPNEIGKLSRLVLFDLSFNHISGPIPESASGLNQLQYLVLDHNPINSGVPFFVGTLKGLISISLSGCGLTGSVPKTLSLLKNLTALSLDNNSLTGHVPPDLGSLQSLHLLNLSQNLLSGELDLSEEFIDSLGNRLDVRGNKGLCTSNKISKKKNRPFYYQQIPTCLVTQEIGENKTSPKRMRESWSKSSSNVELFHQKMILLAFCFVFSFLVVVNL
ncbi:hypothetical protein ACFE04_012110 [Oxalis oulophora]